VTAADRRELAARPGEGALWLGFDGTLAPIVRDPATGTAPPRVVELLARLAPRLAAVALVSGRPAEYLAEHAPAEGVRHLGLYGLQEIHDGRVRVDPRLAGARPAGGAAGGGRGGA